MIKQLCKLRTTEGKRRRRRRKKNNHLTANSLSMLLSSSSQLSLPLSVSFYLSVEGYKIPLMKAQHRLSKCPRGGWQWNHITDVPKVRVNLMGLRLCTRDQEQKKKHNIMSSRSFFSLPLSTSITLNPCLPFCLSYIITVQSVSPFDVVPLLPVLILPSSFPVQLMY